MTDNGSKKLALTAAGDYLATVNAVLGLVDTNAGRLALKNTNTLLTTVNAAIGLTDSRALTLATENMSTLATTVTGQLATDKNTQKLSGLLVGNTSSKLTVDGNVIFDPSNPMQNSFDLMNSWLGKLDDKTQIQNQSLEYLLAASIASSKSARMAVAEQSIAKLTNEISAAIGSSYQASKLKQSTSASGETTLSYVDRYKTTVGSVSSTGVVSPLSRTVSAKQSALLISDTTAAAAAKAAAASKAAAAKAAAKAAWDADPYAKGKPVTLANFNSAKYIASNPDVLSVATFARNPYLHFIRYGQYENRRYAKGGIADGWSMVGEEGPEIVNFTQPGRVYTANDTAKMFASNDDSANEIKQLRAELQAIGLALAKNTGEAAKILRKFDGDGMPAERVLAA